MCGRFSLSLDSATLNALFDAYADESMDSWKPSWNLAPSQRAPSLERASEGSGTQLRLRSWGTSSNGRTLINIRSEGLTPARLSAKGLRRCAIPADSFYEWRRSRGASTPYLLARSDGEPLALAALCEPGADGFAIITRTSGPPLDSIHHRVPLLLEKDTLHLWLDSGNAYEAISQPQPALSMRKVDPRVNSVAFNSPEAHAEFNAPEEMQLL